MKQESLLDTLTKMLDQYETPNRVALVKLEDWPDEEKQERGWLSGGKELLSCIPDDIEFEHGRIRLIVVSGRAYYERTGKKWIKRYRPNSFGAPKTAHLKAEDVMKLFKPTIVKKGDANGVHAEPEANANQPAG